MKFTYFKTPPEHRTAARVMFSVGIVCLVFAVLMGIGFLGIRALAASVPGSDTAARWTGEGSTYPFAQLAVYCDDGSAYPLDTLYRYRTEIQKKLEENAISSQKEGGRLFLDAFSGETRMSVSTDRTTASVTATAAGGNFFYFHPMKLICGSYFKEGDGNPNTAILDENAAWQLFGATEVAGLEVEISGQPFTVTGVVRAPSSEVERKACGDAPRIYVNYMGLRLVCGMDSITCYEVLLPNPIDAFAANLLKDVFGISASVTDKALCDGSTRFSFGTLIDGRADFFTRVMRADRVIPPWWENVARVAENKAVVIAFFTLTAEILAGVLLAVFLLLWFLIHPVRVRDIYGYFDDKRERKRMKKWLLAQQKARNGSVNTQTHTR